VQTEYRTYLLVFFQFFFSNPSGIYLTMVLKITIIKIIVVHFSCYSWCRGGSRTRCIPQGSEICGFRWSLYVCSHCLWELGSTKRFNSPAPFIPWPKIDRPFGRKPQNQLPVSEMLILRKALFNAVLLHDSLPDCDGTDY